MKTTQACVLLSLTLLGEACLLPGEASGARITLPLNYESQQHGCCHRDGRPHRQRQEVLRGLGSRPAGTKLPSLLNVNEIKSAVNDVVQDYDIGYFELQYKTYQNASFFNAKISGERGNCSDPHHVCFNAAIHARESGSSNDITYFISNRDVKHAVATGIVFAWLSNSDRVAYDQAIHTCWWKNRNPAASGGDPEAIGIGLNLNTNFLFDFPEDFATTVAPNVAFVNSADATYHDANAFSEPGTKSIKWVVDEYERETLSDEGVYGEYIPNSDWPEEMFAAARLGHVMDAVVDRPYEVEQSSYLYPTSGTSDHFANSRHFTDAWLGKIHSFVLKFGSCNEGVDCSFYPTPDQSFQHEPARRVRNWRWQIE
ncbi:zinc carboxypeptidase [Colletotrichum orchidophilum]|uniref:Zinc carboxypeptidase n=1 Tax=Colletotrichum orchidophilum TaxID=1209926 RepID=A0A1G4BQT9_9PEZI|nr:zinc carboxypeptidase [Colletotrichum orchidophilum]OHF03809.1 zinc carboxypeptidase [Colletotrichum orchidophilum]